MDTVHKAEVFEVDIRVASAHRMPLVGALARFVLENERVVILDSADAIIGQVDRLEHAPTIIAVGDSVDPAHRFELRRAVLDQLVGVFRRNLENALTVVGLHRGRFVQLAEVGIGFVVLAADRSGSVGTKGLQAPNQNRGCE